MQPQGSFTQNLWDRVESIYQDILDSTFVQQLTAGTLSRDHFAFYLQQDILYINDDAKAFHIVADCAKDKTEQAFFRLMAEDGVETEKILHNQFLSYFDIKSTTEKSKVCSRYTSFLLHHAQNSDYAIAISALLPCFWIYTKVGEYIVTHSVEDNPYKKWVDTYAGDEYKAYTTQFIQIVENQSKKVDSNTKNKMTEAFIEAAQFELNFFEEGKNPT